MFTIKVADVKRDGLTLPSTKCYQLVIDQRLVASLGQAKARAAAGRSMRFLTFETKGAQRPGLRSEDGRIVDLIAALDYARDQGALSFKGQVSLTRALREKGEPRHLRAGR